MKKLPKELYRYFWDIDPTKLDVDARGEYIISRLMDYGGTADVRWMQQKYGEAIIRETLKTMRGIRRPSAYYWARRLSMPIAEVKCLQIPYRAIPYGV